jgi:hypothetical protein
VIDTMLEDDAWRLGYFAASEAPEYAIMRLNQERFRAFQKQNSGKLKNHFYITVVPKTLDLLECCLTFLPRNLNLFLILNGLNKWEQDFIEARYGHIPQFVVETNDSIMYARILDLLVETNDSNFGVLDQDCFVLDPNFFRRLGFHRGEFAISPFVTLNKAAQLTFPRTYWLFFNLPVIKRIRDKHRISFKRCWRIPPHLEEHLATLNLGYGNFPHESLGYFDDFQLIWAMAIYEGLTFRRTPGRSLFGWPKYRIAHVGAGDRYLTEEFRDRMIESLRSYETLGQLDQEILAAAAFSYYVHMLLLENTESEELRQAYMPFFSACGTSRNLLQTFGSIMHPRRVEEMDGVVREMRRRKKS